MDIRKNFNLMVSAFRKMEGDRAVLRGMLTTALNDTRWNGWRKVGITQAALERVSENRARYGDQETYRWFKDCQAAHMVARRDYCHALVSRDFEDAYAYMQEQSKCVVATKEENATDGWEHFSEIHPLNPDLFAHGASNSVLKRHPDYPAFLELLDKASRNSSHAQEAGS